jgi:AcrR family transcriptional regulator
MGRPRSPEARSAATEATLELLLEGGLPAVTFDEVAARSGVAKSTLYRHFGSKQAMVVEAVRSSHEVLPTPDTGALAEDLRQLFAGATDAQEERRVPEVTLAVLAASRRDPELRALLDEVLDELRRPLRTVLRLAQLRGEVPADLDLDLAVTLLVAPFTHRRLVDQAPVDDAFTEAVIGFAVAAVRAPADAIGR